MKKKSQAKKGTVKRIASYTKPYSRSLIGALISAIFYVVLNLTTPVLIGNAIDKAIGMGNVDFSGMLNIIALIILTVIGSAFFQWLMALFTNTVSYMTVRDMRRDIFEKFNDVPLKYIDGHSHGDLISRVINDIDAVGDGLLQGVTQLFSGAVMIIGTLVFMVSIDYRIAAVVVIISPLSIFVATMITRLSHKMFLEQSKTQGEISSYVEEIVGNQKTVKAFGYEERSIDSFEEINERLRVCGQKSQFYSSLANPSTRFVNAIITAAVTIVGSINAINGVISVGQISCFLTYANQYTKPFNEVTGVIPQLQSALAGASRAFEILDEPEQDEDLQSAVKMNDCKGAINIENVCFSYSPDRKLIENFNLKVKPGERVAIVGPTGCGKTTLINLLMRFYDINSGKISIDGVDIQNITRNSLRSLYGMVLQESWLYNATIAENIAYGKPDASIDEIREAAKKSYIDGYIRRLPDGYDTIITEEGMNLSQGQRQLMCIARVMLCDPPMLILDEATSSIDTRTEIRVQRAFNTMMKGRTSFIVAHRLSTIKEADIILVMKDGHIIEQGNHNELLSRGGFYSTLYNSQFSSSVTNS